MPSVKHGVGIDLNGKATSKLTLANDGKLAGLRLLADWQIRHRQLPEAAALAPQDCPVYQAGRSDSRP